MACSSQKFNVFDFDEEEKQVEKDSAKLVGKFRIQKRKRGNNDVSSPLTKYKFLQCFGGCTGAVKQKSSNEPIDIDDEPIDVDSEGETNTLCKGNCDKVVDADATVIDDQCKYSVSLPTCMPQKDCAMKEEISQLDTLRLSIDTTDEKEPVDMVSDNDARIEKSSSSVSTLAENEVPFGKEELESGSVGHIIDLTHHTVAVFPDYIICGDIYCTKSRLTFSRSSIKVEGPTVNGIKGTFNVEWTINDIISVESEWCGTVKTAMVYLCFKLKVSKGARNADDTSEVEKLQFSVYDSHWHEGEEAIKSLDDKYKDIWNATHDSILEKDGNASFGHIGVVFSKPYFPIFPEKFEEVIYPKGDPDAVSISKADVELLCPETFINDTIIDFYIQYLKNKIQIEDRHRFHFFNSFFFRKLADLDKGPSNACEGRAAFLRVQKWTRKVNLFEKDYIFIPVNYSLHWSLIVICHPGEVVHSRVKEDNYSFKVPCILHMDSIRGSHRGLKNLIQSYLYEEWKERHKEIVDDNMSSKFLHLRFLPLELPQQENSYDCGLFLLHYVELFLEGAPTNFSPFKITEFSNFLNRNWFLPEEASLKRASIQKLICEILEDQSSPQFSDTNEHEDVFLEETCSAASGPDTDLGIQISLTATSPMSAVQQWQQTGEQELNFRDLFKPQTRRRSFSNENCWQTRAFHWSGCMSPLKEVEETGEQFSESASDTEDDWEAAGLATEFSPTSFSREDPNYNQLEESYDDSSSEASMSASLKSSKMVADEDHSLPQLDSFDHQKQRECHELSSTSTEPEDLGDCVVEDSQEGNCKHNGHEANDSPSSFLNTGNCDNLAAPVDEINATENILRKVRKPMSNLNLASGEQTAEMMKLISPDGST